MKFSSNLDSLSTIYCSAANTAYTYFKDNSKLFVKLSPLEQGQTKNIVGICIPSDINSVLRDKPLLLHWCDAMAPECHLSCLQRIMRGSAFLDTKEDKILSIFLSRVRFAPSTFCKILEFVWTRDNILSASEFGCLGNYKLLVNLSTQIDESILKIQESRVIRVLHDFFQS